MSTRDWKSKKFEKFFIISSYIYDFIQFPGKFTIEPELKQDIKFNFQTKFSERLSTGYYLPAGINLLINVDYISNDQIWSIMIGSHSDDLSNCNQIKRWPSVTICKELTSSNLVISSPFGGLIFVLSPEHGVQIIRNIKLFFFIFIFLLFF